MKVILTAGLLVMLLAGFVTTAKAQNPPALLDKIARSLPQIDPEWRYKSTDVSERSDGTVQANIKWRKHDVERGATIIIHSTVKKARQAFRPSGKEDLQESFRIEGIGDEAFLWPPEAPKDGAYNMRFRKARVEVWISAGSEDEVKRYARAIAAAVAPPRKDL